MSDSPTPDAFHPPAHPPHAAEPLPRAAAAPLPHRNPPLPPPPPRRRTPVLGCLFSLSMLINVVAFVVILVICASHFVHDPDNPNIPLDETYYSGTKTAQNKIAIIQLDGVIMEGLLSYPRRQIEQAAKDDAVKAVVFRIDSPGGSITGSDDLHRRLVELRDGNTEKGTKAKPIIVSMGSMAASGGYYVAMPGQTIVAERTTLTGSIGVYGAFPNIAELEQKWQLGELMHTIKQGEIKDSGSPFRKMSDKEQQVWQDMVDTAYDTFLDVVADGRKPYHFDRPKLLEAVDVTPVNAGPGHLSKNAKSYERYRADGGVWTADMALKLNLIDKVGTLDDAVNLAKKAAGVGDYKAIEYLKPHSLRELLLGVKTNQPGSVLDPATLRKGMTPRLWYLAPGSEMAGLFSAMEEP